MSRCPYSETNCREEDRVAFSSQLLNTIEDLDVNN